MHEMGLAASVLDIVRQHVPEAQASHVRRVRMRIGELAGVQSDSLRFCFDALVVGTPFERATLEVAWVAATRSCNACGRQFRGVSVLASCPDCGSGAVPFVLGTELMVDEVELDDGAEVRS